MCKWAGYNSIPADMTSKGDEEVRVLYSDENSNQGGYLASIFKLENR